LLTISRAKFLTTDERAEVERRLIVDHGNLSNTFAYKYVFHAIKDWKIYVHMLICMAGFCPIYSFSLFLPTIIKNMGYTANDAQLMSVPPYVFACFFTIMASWFADRSQQRGVYMLVRGVREQRISMLRQYREFYNFSNNFLVF